MTSDTLIQDLGGCGRFQWILSFVVYLVHIPRAFSTLFMSFGARNPGWKCLDIKNKTKKHGGDFDEIVELNSDNIIGKNALGYIMDSCGGFEDCKNVEYNPGVSTVVTEWGLGCDKEWIMSLIITLQLIGGIVGGLFIGYLGDKFGRKVTLLTVLLLSTCFNFACAFSMSVEMFGVFRFLIGFSDVALARLPAVYMLEFVPIKWRCVVGNIPVWTIGGIMFAVCAMVTQNWVQLHLIVAVLCFGCFLSVFWAPESFRWLAVNEKTGKCLETGEKIAKLNRSDFNSARCIGLVKDVSKERKMRKEHVIFDLFRKEFSLYSTILGFCIMCGNVFYYVAHFEVSFLHSNVYVNMMLLLITDLPASLIAAYIPGIFGRKLSINMAFMFQCVCLFIAVANELVLLKTARDLSIVALVLVGKVGTSVALGILHVYVAELYPTVIRNTAGCYGGAMGVIGLIVAPYFVPKSDGKFYLSYLFLSVLAAICSCLILLVPDTKGKPLEDTWSNKKCGTEIISSSHSHPEKKRRVSFIENYCEEENNMRTPQRKGSNTNYDNITKNFP